MAEGIKRRWFARGGPSVGESDLIQQIETLKAKLARAERRLAGLREKSKHLEMQYEDARTREQNSHELIMELIERQRELNVMLNRANIMLNRTQEAMALTSMELNEMAKALPEPKKAEWAERVARINELFKKTGVQDAELLSLGSSESDVPKSLETDELKKQADQLFNRKESIWQRTERPKPPNVEAEPVEDDTSRSSSSGSAEDDQLAPEITIRGTDSAADSDSEESTTETSRPRKSWWQRLAG